MSDYKEKIVAGCRGELPACGEDKVITLFIRTEDGEAYKFILREQESIRLKADICSATVSGFQTSIKSTLRPY